METRAGFGRKGAGRDVARFLLGDENAVVQVALWGDAAKKWFGKIVQWLEATEDGDTYSQRQSWFHIFTLSPRNAARHSPGDTNARCHPHISDLAILQDLYLQYLDALFWSVSMLPKRKVFQAMETWGNKMTHFGGIKQCKGMGEFWGGSPS